MIKVNDVVLYKKGFARVSEVTNDKITLQTSPDSKSFIKVRPKDVALLPLVAKSIEDIFNDSKNNNLASDLNDAYSLLLDDDAKNIAFNDLCELIDYKECNLCRLLFERLISSAEFSLDEVALKSGNVIFKIRSKEEVAAIKEKAYTKEHEADIFNEYIARIKKQLTKNKKSTSTNLATQNNTISETSQDELKNNKPQNFLTADDKKRLQEVERVALGQSTFSKTMAALHQKIIPEAAHKLLLDLSVWPITRNPYPTRGNLPTNSNALKLPPPPADDRVEIPGIFYAIDNEYSDDPDDAVGFDGEYLWVHIADAAAAITPGDKIDIAARNRGTTLYLPETTVRMLNEEALTDYALGLKSNATYGTAEKDIPLDNALSFCLKLDNEGSVTECKILKTKVKIARLTYAAADSLKNNPPFKILFDIAKKNIARRNANGAVNIDLPEVHIGVNNGIVDITAEQHYESNDMVREMMLLAGVGAAKFAFENKIPFPYVTQPISPLATQGISGMALEYSKIRCMRPRALSTSPAAHSALGLPMYTQVTSPLRRYIDLISHEQLRLYLSKKPLIPSDEMFSRIAESDLAMSAAKIASRKSEQHWTLVWLLQNPNWIGEATCVGEYLGEYTLIINTLGLWTKLRGVKLELNEVVKLRIVGLDLATLRADFAIVK